MKEENACGFGDRVVCDDNCQYYFTCTRNPKYMEIRQKELQKKLGHVKEGD